MLTPAPPSSPEPHGGTPRSSRQPPHAGLAIPQDVPPSLLPTLFAALAVSQVPPPYPPPPAPVLSSPVLGSRKPGRCPRDAVGRKTFWGPEHKICKSPQPLPPSSEWPSDAVGWRGQPAALCRRVRGRLAGSCSGTCSQVKEVSPSFPLRRPSCCSLCARAARERRGSAAAGSVTPAPGRPSRAVEED